MDDSFVSKLRMNNIFPTGGGGSLGPPDMNSGNDVMSLFQQIFPYIAGEKEKDRQHELNKIRLQNSGHLEKIANDMHEPPPQKPMNVVAAKPEESLFQKDTLKQKQDALAQQGKLGEEKIQQIGKLGEERIGNTKQGLKIKQEQIDINDFKAKHPGMKFAVSKGGNFVAEDPLTGRIVDSGVSTGTLSDENKITATGEQRMNQIDAQGQNRMDQIGAQGENARDVQYIRGNQQDTSLGTRGEQNLAAIRERGNQQRETNAAKPSMGTTTTSEKVTPGKPGLFGTSLGATAEKRVTTTTKKGPTDNNSNNTPLPTEPPPGSKKGKWVRTKYGPAWLED